MKTVVIGFLGQQLDSRGKGKKRWESWRPSVGLCMQEDVIVDRIELLHDRRDARLANEVGADIQTVSAETEVVLHQVAVDDPWDFEQMYSLLHAFAESYSFKSEEERYLLHITTGTHVAQICWFLLCEANYIPAKLLQTSPGRGDKRIEGTYQVIDLDLSKYDQLNSRFKSQHLQGTEFLKSGIATRSERFNSMIQQIEKVAIRSKAPILFMGPTGAGKSQLAKKVYELKVQRGLLRGEFVSVNCATLRGDNAMSTLFGHTKGAFTGALTVRQGLLGRADKGLLFLDEIGELGLDEQAMLLHAIEDKRFYPMGSDRSVGSDFQLLAGTNKDLRRDVEQGFFRGDLLARINLWSYTLPALKDRKEDIEPNIDYELRQLEQSQGHKVSFNKSAKQRFLRFARSSEAEWSGNFRDLNAAITRLATLADGGRITELLVAEEEARLLGHWSGLDEANVGVDLEDYLNLDVLADIDQLDKWQLQKIILTCRDSQSLSDAGRALFDKSRLKKASTNDSHRLRQILSKFGLTFNLIKSK